MIWPLGWKRLSAILKSACEVNLIKTSKLLSRGRRLPLAVITERGLGGEVNFRWAIVAVSAGIVAAIVPPALGLVILGLVSLLLIGVAQPVALLMATLIVAPLKALIDTESAIKFDPGQIMLALTAAIWLVNRILTRRPIVRGSAIYLPIVIILISASFSLFVAIAPVTTLTELSKWVEMLGVAAIVATIGAERGWGWPFVGLVAATSANAAIGLYQFFGGSGAPSLWIIDNQHFRAFGTFGQPNPFGAFMGLTLPLVIGLIGGLVGEMIHLTPQPPLRNHGEGEPNAAHRRIICVTSDRNPADRPLSVRTERGSGGEVLRLLGLAACAALLFGALIASWSRGSWLGLGAALFVMLMFAPRRRAIGIGVAGGIAVIGFVLYMTGLLPASISARLGDFSSELGGFGDMRGQVITGANYAVLERLAHWQAGLAMADAHPWLGVGFGNYEAAYPQYGLPNWKFPLGHAHNYFINVLAETGLVGLSGYVIAWVIIVGLTIQVLRRTHGAARGLALGALGSWTYLAVHSIFDKLYVDNLFLHVGAILGLIGGLHLSSTRVKQSNSEHEQYVAV